jgi:hypothetical protein
MYVPGYTSVTSKGTMIFNRKPDSKHLLDETAESLKDSNSSVNQFSGRKKVKSYW